MCINQRQIINKGYRPLDIKTSQYINCKCGHCIQCQSERSAAYAYRVQREVNDHPGCLPFYVTFTYAEKWLPYLEYFDEDGNLKSLSVWNRQHVIRLNKVLRRQINYYYGVTSDAFKFLSCCERGSDREYTDDYGHYRVATERPHIHNMYVVYNVNTLKPIRPLPDAFLAWVKKNNCGLNFRSFFMYLLDTRWIYGHVEDLQVTRSVSTCSRYIATYCTKNINENLSNIPLSKIYRLIDPEYSDRYLFFKDLYLDRINAFGFMDNHFKTQCKSFWSMSHNPKHTSIPQKRFFDFKVTRKFSGCGKLSLMRYKPAAIKFSHLNPLTTQSNNVGYLDTPENNWDLVHKMVSGKLVTLAGSKKASTIPLPYYYYKKLCKASGQCLDYIWVPYHDGISWRQKFTEPIIRKVQDWNNVDGCFIDFRKKVYTLSWYTKIGEYVRHKFYRSKLNRTVHSLRCMLSNSGYFDILYNDFLALDKKVREGMSFLVCGPDAIYSARQWLSAHLDRLPSLLKQYFHLDRIQLKNLSYEFKQLDVLLKTFSLCRTTFSYKNQIAYRKQFKDGLTRKGLQDPELLIPHFINVYNY